MTCVPSSGPRQLMECMRFGDLEEYCATALYATFHDAVCYSHPAFGQCIIGDCFSAKLLQQTCAHRLRNCEVLTPERHR